MTKNSWMPVAIRIANKIESPLKLQAVKPSGAVFPPPCRSRQYKLLSAMYL